jgi:hypothetical protein
MNRHREAGRNFILIMDRHTREKVAGELVKLAKGLAGKSVLANISEEEAIEELEKLAKENGSDWKEKLLNAWMDGAYKRHLRMYGIEDWKLQRIRNKFGPKWLQKIRVGSSRKANKVAMHPATIKKLVREVDPQLANDLSSKIIWGRGVVKSLNRLGINDIKGLPFQGYDVYNVVFKNGDNEMMRGKKVRELIYNLLQKRGLTASRKAARGAGDVMDKEKVARELLKIAKDLIAVSLRKGMKFGDWVVTQYTPIEWDDLGISSGGHLKLVNQDTMDSFDVRYDNALRGAKWWYDGERVRVEDKSPLKVIKKALKYIEQGRNANSRVALDDFKHGIEVGEILVSSWGYDQTNIDFYEVVGVTNKSVKIRKVDKKVVKSSPPQDYVVPIRGKYIGSPKTKRVNPNGYVKISSYAYAYEWDGKPKYQTSWGYGH